MTSFEIDLPTLAPELGCIKQIAFVVDDIDEAIARWHHEFGVGPFVVARDTSPLRNALYRGERSKPAAVDLAFAYIGELQLELIELKNDAPSMYKEVLERGQRDLQHYGTCVDDFDEACKYAAANGFQPVVEVGIKGLARMHYVEATDFAKNVFASDEQSFMKTPEGHGIVLELIEENALTRPYFEGIKTLVESVPDGQLIQEFKINDLAPKAIVLASLGRFVIKKLMGRV